MIDAALPHRGMADPGIKKPRWLQRRQVVALLLCAVVPLTGTVAAATAASAPGADPAVAQVQQLSAALLKAMKAGKSLSMNERFRTLEPIIQQSFALPLMTRIAVGPDNWGSFSQDQQQQSIAAFGRFTTANYAYNFRNYDGESFDVESTPRTRGNDKLVQSRIVSRDGNPTSLLYRLRQVDGNWKILDVYSEGVSELTLRRSDFTAAINTGGAPELLRYLQRASDGLMKR